MNRYEEEAIGLLIPYVKRREPAVQQQYRTSACALFPAYPHEDRWRFIATSTAMPVVTFDGQSLLCIVSVT